MVNLIGHSTVQKTSSIITSCRKAGLNTQEVKYDAIIPSFKGSGDKKQ